MTESELSALTDQVWRSKDGRPKGGFQADAVVPISDDRLVLMQYVTRAHLLAWALREDDDRNLAYIKSRLDLWDAYPECKTLAELEASQ